jgi:uncharacterized protein (TIGR03067 family)
MSKLALIAFLAIGVPVKEERTDESKKVLDSLQGDWQMVKLDIGDLPLPPMDKGLPRFVFQGNKITIVDQNRNEEAEFKIDVSKKPYTIDIRALNKGPKEEQLKGIFEITGDTLKIRFFVPELGKGKGGGGDRPTDFNSSAPNTPAVAFVFQRTRPK